MRGTLLFFILLTWLPFAAANNSAGELEISHADGRQDVAVLLATEVSGKVSGMIASIRLKQTFKNNSDQWVNGRYVFPLPFGAAVDSLRIEVGERVIEGVIKEKEKAKKVFEQAKKAGKKAGLLEQHRPNLFSISVANIAPFETITANITFIDQVHYENNTFSLRLPTTLTPRYIPGATIKSIETARQELAERFSEADTEATIDGAGWAANTDLVCDASDITPPQTYPAADQTDHVFSLALSIDAGLNLQSVSSTTHRIASRFTNSKQVSIELSNSQELMDRDLVISWQPNIGSAPKAALFQQKYNDAYYSLLMVTPPTANASLSLPRDITFLVDSSGSMAGGSMQQAKQALLDGLSYLSANDRFNIIDFDSDFRPLFTSSQPVTPQRLMAARRMINQLSADGGTEMMGALQYALDQHSDTTDGGQNPLRQIVFITDGAIGNETELFKLLHDKLGDARLFTVGIGSAPNAYFMTKAARFGRGSYTYISDLQQVSTKMTALFTRITHPVLRDIAVDWQQKNIEQYPAKLPDLYAGQPLTVLVRSSKPIRKASIAGEMLGTPWRKMIKPGKRKQLNTRNLDTVWARKKVASLMDQLISGELPLDTIKPLIIDLGVTHKLVTKFTSFVAIEKEPSRPEHLKAKHKNIPNLMPKGSTMQIPQTASAADLFSLLGGLVILIGVFMRRHYAGLA